MSRRHASTPDAPRTCRAPLTFVVTAALLAPLVTACPSAPSPVPDEPPTAGALVAAGPADTVLHAEPERLSAAHHLLGVGGVVLGVTLRRADGLRFYALGEPARAVVAVPNELPRSCSLLQGEHFVLFDGEPIGLLALRSPKLAGAESLARLYVYDPTQDCFADTGPLDELIGSESPSACSLALDDPEQVSATASCELLPEVAGAELVTLTQAGLRIDAEGSIANPEAGASAYALSAPLLELALESVFESDATLVWGPLLDAVHQPSHPSSMALVDANDCAPADCFLPTKVRLQSDPRGVRVWLEQTNDSMGSYVVRNELEALMRTGQPLLRLRAAESYLDDDGDRSDARYVEIPVVEGTLRGAYQLDTHYEHPDPSVCRLQRHVERWLRWTHEQDRLSVELSPTVNWTPVTSFGLMFHGDESGLFHEENLSLDGTAAPYPLILDRKRLCWKDAEDRWLRCADVPECGKVVAFAGSDRIDTCDVPFDDPKLGSVWADVESDGAGSLRVLLIHTQDWDDEPRGENSTRPAEVEAGAMVGPADRPWRCIVEATIVMRSSGAFLQAQDSWLSAPTEDLILIERSEGDCPLGPLH